ASRARRYNARRRTDSQLSQCLSIYSAKEIATMVTIEGTVTADCQFCGAHYTFAPETLGFEAKDASA
ncbi:MAG: Hsp33 family molecular chaperone HslO, partial [Pseudomonadota bacterium]